MMFRFIVILSFLLPHLLFSQEISKRLILIGDAGEMNKNQQLLIQSASKMTIAGQTNVYFLGDNIYPTGMGLDSKGKEEGIEILKSQYEPFLAKNVRIHFLAGNHDWDRSGKYGFAKLKAQEEYFNNLNNEDISFVPQAGDIGPYVDSIADNLLTVIYDSEYWLFPHHGVSNQDSIEQSKIIFLENLKSIADKNIDKQFIVLSHHPMISYGEHALKFGFIDHIFPLTHVWKGAYLPLPIVGSLYPLVRSTILHSPEELTHKKYKILIEGVTKSFENHPNVLFVSGHDHGLQFIVGQDVKQIVSGSGAKSSHIRSNKDLLYKYGNQGYTILDCYDDGHMIVQFFIVEGEEVRKSFEYVLNKHVSNN